MKMTKNDFDESLGMDEIRDISGNSVIDKRIGFIVILSNGFFWIH